MTADTRVVVVHGACEVQVGTGSAGALESLGWTIDGPDEEYEPFYAEVKGDQNGGQEGPPIEWQYLGELVHLRLELSRFNPAIFQKLQAIERGGTAGVIGTPGDLMFGSGKYTRVLLNSPTSPVNFPTCIINRATYQRRTKYSQPTLEFTAAGLTDGAGVLVFGAGGILYNSSTS